MSHTPGPWTFDNAYVIRSAAGHSVASMSTGTLAGPYSDERLMATARLIAAAPDLLEALHYIHDNCGDPRMEAVCERVIAQAEGR